MSASMFASLRSEVQHIDYHHCMVDAYEGDPIRLDDAQIVSNFLVSGLPQELFTIAPYTLYFDGDGKEDMKGVTGFFLGLGAHMTLHTYSHQEKRCVFFDGFGIDVKAPRKLFSETFGTQDHEVWYSERENLCPLPERSLPDDSYGPHLLLSGQLQQPLLPHQLYTCLKELPAQIGMTPLVTPVVTVSGDRMSGIVIIAESHIAIHIDHRLMRCDVDVFSCRPFDVDTTIRLLKQLLGLSRAVSQALVRGRQFYKTH